MIKNELSSKKNLLTVKELCFLCSVSRSGYYNWIAKEPARQAREAKDLADFTLILEAYNFRGYAKGARSIHMRLLHMGIRMNIKKIRRLMKKYALYCPIRKPNPYRQMAKKMRTNAVADNLLKREFKEHGPRKVLLTDITYIPYDKKFCYLSVIKDAFTEQVLSYVLSQSLEVDFVLQTINKLIEEHGDSIPETAMVHSDQGCHYTSVSFRKLISDLGLRQSMSRRGNCWDNAPQESFFGHMKDELAPKQENWNCFEDVSYDVDDWMDYYNNDRGQWGLQKLSPNEFYQYITTGNYPASMLR